MIAHMNSFIKITERIFKDKNQGKIKVYEQDVQ